MSDVKAEAQKVEALREPVGGVLEALLRTNAVLSAELDLDKLLQILTDEATALCRAAFGAFFYNSIGVDGETFTLFTISGVDRKEFEKFPMPRKTRVFKPTFDGEGPVRMDDVTRDPRFGKNAPYCGMPEGHLPVRSYLALPVVAADGEVIGGLFFGHPEPSVFTARDEALIAAVASQAAIAIEKARLHEQVVRERDREARRAQLAERIGMALSQPGDVDNRLQTCCEELVGQLDAAFARIWRYDETSRMLLLKASAGMYTHLDGQHSRVPLGCFKIGQVAEDRLPHLTNDVLSDPQVTDKVWARREGMVAFAGFPLLHEDRLLGVMAMFFQSSLPQATIHLLSGAAHQVSMALDADRVASEREEFRQIFIDMLGHDLRNPLSAIATGTGALALDPSLSDRGQRILRRMASSTKRMGRMVTQLLDFARMRGGVRGDIPVDRVECDLYDVFRDVVEELRTAHPGRQIDDHYQGDGRGSWDRDRLAQVGSNLVGNALIHGDPASPVRLSFERSGDQVIAEVQNDGAPIPTDVMDNLLDPFARERSRYGGSEGLGLGLYISHQIVFAHGGRMSVTSNEQDGTRVRLEIPCRAP